MSCSFTFYNTTRDSMSLVDTLMWYLHYLHVCIESDMRQRAPFGGHFTSTSCLRNTLRLTDALTIFFAIFPLMWTTDLNFKTVKEYQIPYSFRIFFPLYKWQGLLVFHQQYCFCNGHWKQTRCKNVWRWWFDNKANTCKCWNVDMHKNECYILWTLFVMLFMLIRRCF